jgi:hypothetical protein
MTVESIKAELSALLAAVKPAQELIQGSYENLVELEGKFTDLARQVAATDRDLRIAVVGQVKAGKSSFLNALLFGGDEILPKAITPKTAALTIIRYGEKMRAEIEFYDGDEWRSVQNNADNYRQWCGKERERILQEQENDKSPGRRWKLTEEDLDDDYFRDRVPEIYLSAFELVTMVRESGVATDSYLGRKITIEAGSPAELSAQLNEYVGVDGRFTPLVKCSYLYYDLPQLQGVEIVDTPGLNDPVLSRGQLTKKFLAKCDVAFLLSYACQFLDQSDMNLLHEQLPESGIKDVIVAGSKFDLLLKGEKKKHAGIGSLLDALEGTLRKRAQQEFSDRLRHAGPGHEENMYRAILDNLRKIPVQFISSLTYGAAQHFDQPADEEKRLIDGLNALYPDSGEFDAAKLLELSNLGEGSAIRAALAQKHAEKDRIIAEKMGAFLTGQRDRLLRIRREIRDEASRGKDRLLSGDIRGLEERSARISTRLKGGQGRIEVAFEEGICAIKQKLSLLLTDMKEVSTRFSRVDVKTEQKVESYEVSTSRWYNPFSWGGSESRSRTVTYRYADTHEAINQVEEYVIVAEKRLKKSICDLIDTAALKREIQEAVTALFDLGDPNLDIENDIMIPIRRAIAKITVPDIDLGSSDYTKEITSKFSQGRVGENQVEALRSAQKNAIVAVLKNLQSAVNAESLRAISCLEKVQKEFTGDLVAGIVADLEGLSRQLKEREGTLYRYDNLLASLEAGGTV